MQRQNTGQIEANSEPVRQLRCRGDELQLLPKQCYETRYTPARGVIGFAFESQCGEHAFASTRHVSFSARANSFSYVPPGCDVYSCSPTGGEYLVLATDPIAIRDKAVQRRFNDAVDPSALRAARSLRRVLIGGSPPDPLCLERDIAVLRELSYARLCGCLVDPRPARWMTPHRLRRVDEFIDGHLGDGLTVSAIAAHLGLSAGFFSRAFKASVGQSPHDYVIDWRLSRARQLMLATTADLGHIAAETGFASHSHMTAVFQQRLGIAPGALRGVPESRRVSPGLHNKKRLP